MLRCSAMQHCVLCKNVRTVQIRTMYGEGASRETRRGIWETRDGGVEGTATVLFWDSGTRGPGAGRAYSTYGKVV